MGRAPGAVVLAFLGTVVAAPNAALAGGGPSPEEIAAVSVYVEQIPTAAGPKAAGDAKPRKTTLPASLRAEIQRAGGSDAAKLEEIATSSAYGARQVRVRAPKSTSFSAPRPGEERPLPEASGQASAAATGVVGEADDQRLIGLAVVLALITGVAAGAAFARRRAPQPTQ